MFMFFMFMLCMFMFFMFMFPEWLAFAGLAVAVRVGDGDVVTAVFALAVLLFTFSAVVQATPKTASIDGTTTTNMLRIHRPSVQSLSIREFSNNPLADFLGDSSCFCSS